MSISQSLKAAIFLTADFKNYLLVIWFHLHNYKERDFFLMNFDSFFGEKKTHWLFTRFWVILLLRVWQKNKTFLIRVRNNYACLT